MQKNIKFNLLLLVLLFSSLQIFAQINEKLIGDRIWMTSNLNISKFQNGDPIYEAKTKAQWNKASEDKKPAWCYYQNNAQNGVIYGKLYNWYAVNDPRGLAPKGWHIPTKSEWNGLISFLQKDFRDVNEALKTKTGWKQYESGGNEVGSDCEYCNGTGQRYSSISYKYITCAICGGTGGDRRYIKKRTLSGNGTNTSGFSAKPGANRFDDGDFNKNIGLVTIWWLTSEATSAERAEYIYISNDDYTPTIDSYSKGYGSSIRLIKDKSKELLEKERLLEEEKKMKDSTAKALKVIEDSIKNIEKIKKIIGKPIQLDGFMVAEFDIPSDFYLESRINLEDAKKACEKLGKGWRLPTIEDLNLIYQTRNKISGFDTDRFYWSSTDVPTNENGKINNAKKAWQQRFRDGLQRLWDKDNSDYFKARPIWASTSDFERDSTRKALKRVSDSLIKVENALLKEILRIEDSLKIAKVIGRPIEFKGLVVAEFNFPNEMNWLEAKKECENLGKGWRLPTEAEVHSIIKNRDESGISNFKFEMYYWCSDSLSGTRLVVFLDSKGKAKTYRTDKLDEKFLVRAVKTE
jgi:uncharacterized protein (TIGR02145 family)